ncbi:MULTISPECIES: hypothetical protein [unclassified Bradyrhizobium]|uniref:hypothetical protein n=1 Tax=unclassified Bradyrhizobium TaxID=2631580 RepID=UPI001BAA3EA8|nr:MULTISPECIES: hypothetical protein [unclassified Bradyrhizobium]MBR1227409.1 hypothetical protein [Bradyrhizobium sp. AUGA SZCCT0176]MBR1299147.1 hypothetical protein [Bradyrhizobium sp. AUGA SZCCT0042]
MRVAKVFLGNDEPAFIAAAAGASIAWGILMACQTSYLGPRPAPPLWQAIGSGIAVGMFLMPFFFMGISRAIGFMSHWAALVLMSAAFYFPLVLVHMRALQLPSFAFMAVSVAYAAAAILVARRIVKWHRRASVQ